MKIKVLGIGSPFGDDQVGWKVVENLNAQKNTWPDIFQSIAIEYYDRPGLRLIELMHDVDIVFLIDAIKSGRKIGTIYRLKNKEIDENKHLLSTHGMGVAEALQLGRVLNQLPETIILYGIEVNEILIQENISNQVMFSTFKVAEQIKSDILTLSLTNKINFTN